MIMFAANQPTEHFYDILYEHGWRNFKCSTESHTLNSKIWHDLKSGGGGLYKYMTTL
jgi:hypothetical protein